MQDLERARAFYAEKLGLTPTSEGRIGIRYQLADGTRFRLFKSTGTSAAAFTQMAFMVDDIAPLVTRLKSRGVRFQEYDGPGLRSGWRGGRRLCEGGVVQGQRRKPAGDRPGLLSAPS